MKEKDLKKENLQNLYIKLKNIPLTPDNVIEAAEKENCDLKKILHLIILNKADILDAKEMGFFSKKAMQYYAAVGYCEVTNNIILKSFDELKEEIYKMIRFLVNHDDLYVNLVGFSLFLKIFCNNQNLIDELFELIEPCFTSKNDNIRNAAFYIFYMSVKKQDHPNFSYKIFDLTKKFIKYEDKSNKTLNSMLQFLGRFAKTTPELKSDILKLVNPFFTNQNKKTRDYAFLVLYKFSKNFKKEMISLIEPFTQNENSEISKSASIYLQKIKNYKNRD